MNLQTASHAAQFTAAGGFVSAVRHMKALLSKAPTAGVSETRWQGIGNLLKAIITVLGAGLCVVIDAVCVFRGVCSCCCELPHRFMVLNASPVFAHMTAVREVATLLYVRVLCAGVMQSVCLCAGADEPTQSAALSAGLPDVVVEALRYAPDESAVRKNAAVVIARLAKHPPVRGYCAVVPCIHCACVHEVSLVCAQHFSCLFVRMYVCMSITMCVDISCVSAFVCMSAWFCFEQTQQVLRDNGGIQALVRLKDTLL